MWVGGGCTAQKLLKGPLRGCSMGVFPAGLRWKGDPGLLLRVEDMMLTGVRPEHLLFFADVVRRGREL